MVKKEDIKEYVFWHEELHEWKLAILHASWIFEYNGRREFKIAGEFAEKKMKLALTMLRELRKKLTERKLKCQNVNVTK